MSTKLQLSVSFAANPRTWPMIDGAVTVDGVDLVITPSHPSEIFWRQLKFADFDVSEMSMSSLMMALAHGDDRWVGMPVFTTRRSSTPACWCGATPASRRRPTSRASASACPSISRPRRCGRAARCSTNWASTPQDMEWWMERAASHSHGGATGFKPPPGVTVHPVPVETRASAR